MPVMMYGISNCDTIKKARQWLAEHEISYTFHDYRKDGLALEQIAAWCEELGWESLLNKRGTTWRKLDQSVRDNVDAHSAAALLLEHPAMIKRPLLVSDSGKLLGFKPDQYEAFFS